MKKEIKNYLHLYLGCDCNVMGVTEDDYADPVIPKTMTLIGIAYDDTQRQWWGYFENQTVGHGSIEDIFPILRPLSDMTEEEANVMWEIMGWNERIKGTQRIGDILNEFTTIEDDNGHYMNCHWGYLIKIIPYMLKQGFDLFGLIDSGLAIDKTKIK